MGFTTLFQLRAADAVRGRVIGTSRFLTSSSVPVAAVLGGVIGVAFTVRTTMLVGAVGMALGLIAVLRLSVRQARSAVVEPEPQG